MWAVTRSSVWGTLTRSSSPWTWDKLSPARPMGPHDSEVPVANAHGSQWTQRPRLAVQRRVTNDRLQKLWDSLSKYTSASKTCRIYQIQVHRMFHFLFFHENLFQWSRSTSSGVFFQYFNKNPSASNLCMSIPAVHYKSYSMCSILLCWDWGS